MAIPIAQIISAAAPLVMSAVDLYRRRNEATTGGNATSGEALQRRLRELEEADLEQSRLIAELSRSLESLARNYEAALAENRRQREKTEKLLWTVAALSGLSLALSIWAIVAR